MDREVLTVQQAAELMQVSTDTVYRLVSSGELSAKKVGRIWRLHCSVIKAYLTSSTNLTPNPREEEIRT